MDQYDIPVVLFIFKRIQKTLQIIDRISEVKPLKIYLVSDGPRNDEERDIVLECRRIAEGRINWECEIIRYYSDVNRGVYDRIGLGAKCILEKEGEAVFIEDDNLPEVSFFIFCREMLERYRDDTRVLWICGTNYLEEYRPSDGSSYFFTRHMLPCGWASWGHKFSKYYDGEMKLLGNRLIRERMKHEYRSRSMYRYDLGRCLREYNRIKKGIQPISWDMQMCFSQRINGMYAIVPMFNQITNIGVDEYSTHGGFDKNNIMTKRFCNIVSQRLSFPLKHPAVVIEDLGFDKETTKLILPPYFMRFKLNLSVYIKELLGLNENLSISDSIKKRLKGRKQK